MRKEAKINESNIIKLTKFNGKKEAFAIWFSQFNMACSVKGCIEALDLNFKKKFPPSEAEAFGGVTSDGKENNKAKV